MGQRADFIAIAAKEIGYAEGPAENETKFGKFTKVDKQPWCGSFVMWCASQVGLKIPNVVGTAWGAEKFKGSGAWKNHESYKPKPGDLAFMDFPNDGLDRISHIAIVEKVYANGLMDTIEGNTTPDGKKGSQRNGGEVARKKRAWKPVNPKKLSVFVIGYGIPKFKD